MTYQKCKKDGNIRSIAEYFGESDSCVEYGECWKPGKVVDTSELPPEYQPLSGVRFVVI